MDAENSGLSPWQCYQRDLRESGFTADAAQQYVAKRTEELYQQLLRIPSSWIDYLQGKLWLRKWTQRQKPIIGIYVWGGVGRGKTWLLDNFFNCLPIENKRRIHFHRFMQHVHEELKRFPNTEDPLHIIASRLHQQARVLCLDEFHVNDITDAMLLAGLLREYFARGGVLVTSSNQPPEKLYWEGLQRERFLPAIALLQQYTTVIHLDSDTDYRLQYLHTTTIWHQPLGTFATEKLQENFAHLVPHGVAGSGELTINSRIVEYVRCDGGVVWFDFSILCMTARSVADYIELAQCFHTVLLDGVPIMKDSENDYARRFIQLIDEFYDRNVRFIVAAAAMPEGLYCGSRLAVEFQRAKSRLREMMSEDYLSREHLPITRIDA